MRLSSMLMFFALGVMVLVSSCGKDHDDPSPQPPDPQPVDSIPSDWLKARTPNDTTHLIDIFFANNTTGYAVGATGEVWKSADGGLSWSSVFQVPDKRGGYNLAVTPNGKVYIVLAAVADGVYTSADGVTFQYQPVGNIDIEADVYFTGNDTGYISGADVLLANGTRVTGLWQTADGGAHWQLVPIPGTNIYARTNDFSFYNPVYGYVVNGASLFRTGGQYNTWSAPVFVSPSFLCGIAAPAEQTVYAADFRGVIHKSTNGGVSFTAVDTLPVTEFSTYINLHFVNAQTGYATAGYVLYKTTDGGFTWQTVLTSKYSLDEVHFTDAGHGWVCGDKGTVLVYRP